MGTAAVIEEAAGASTNVDDGNNTVVYSQSATVSEHPIAPAPSAAGGSIGANCPEGMVMVEGDFFEWLGHSCEDYLNVKQDRCRKYKTRILKEGKARRLRFCMDLYEYPNLSGVKPAVMVDWHDAREACQIEGKRLCTGSEWTLACEGPSYWPYPYGFQRDASACNIDRPRPAPEPDFEAFRKPRAISAEVSRLDLRVASGERERCVSPYGVHDMTGNVDEWVINERHFEPLPPEKEEKDRPYVSGLKGGYWGPIRARCRPMTTAHNEWFRFYQVGFRCCADPHQGALGRPIPRLPKRGVPGLLP